MKDAIIFVCRGFENQDDMETYVSPLEKVVINRFTNIPCYRVFLDDEIRREIFSKEGRFVDDLDSCLNLLISKKVKNVKVVPLLPFYGQWYKIIEGKLFEYEKKFGGIRLSKPIFKKNDRNFESLAVEKTLPYSDSAKEALIEAVSEIIKIKKR